MGADDEKNNVIRQFVMENDIDIPMWTETDKHWESLQFKDRLPARTHGWYEALHMSTAYYKEFSGASKQQYGGVSLWSTGHAAHRVKDAGIDLASGVDRHGLGRWAWTRYAGRNGVSLRVIVAYRPVLNKRGPMSVWNQQKHYWEGHNIDMDPIQKFTHDLKKEVENWIKDGDQIVLGLDVNEDVRNGVFQRTMVEAGLVGLIIKQHGNDGPPTYIDGSVPIDEFFVTPGLDSMRCGYFPMQFDHRSLWMDIPYCLAFGHDLPPIVRPQARRLKLADPRVVKAYVDKYNDYLQKHNLYTKVVALAESKIGDTSLGALYDEVDALRCKGMKYAERYCRKLRCGEVGWSPEWQVNTNALSFWNVLIRKLSGRRVKQKTMERKAAAAGLMEQLEAPLDIAHEQRRLLYQQRKTLREDGYANRKKYITELAEAKAVAGNTKAETELKQLLMREQQRRDARAIRYANRKMRTGSVTYVVAPNGDGEWVEMNVKDDMERALLAENQRRFNQASNTPFLVPPLSDYIDNLGVNNYSQQILDGTFIIPEGTDEYAAKLIPHLKRPALVVPGHGSNLDLTVAEHKRAWKKVREATSSGPSGIHFGHFMAGTTSESVAQFETTMANYPYKSGYSPERWQHGTDVMLEKKAGNF